MLLNALKKRKDGVDLTEEEIALLKEYDGEVAIFNSMIERMKIEKSNLETESTTNNTAVEDLTKRIETLSADVLVEKKVVADKQSKIESLEKIISESESIATAKAETVRLNKEAERLELVKKQEEEKSIILAETKKAEDERIASMEAMKQELEALKLVNKKQQEERVFIDKMSSLKKEKPYLTVQIETLISDVAKQSMTMDVAIATISFVEKTLNHEEEMEKHRAKISGGSILDKVKEDLKKSEDNVGKPTKKTDREDLMDFAKKYGVI
jgi:hypothetical protein